MFILVRRLETNTNESFNPEPKCDSSEPLRMLSLSLPKVATVKIPQNFQISFCTVLKSKCYQVKELTKRFHLMVTPQDFFHKLKSQNYILNKYYNAKVLLKRFHLNGHTTEFCPQTQKLETNTKEKQPLNRFHLHGHTTGFCPQKQTCHKLTA